MALVSRIAAVGSGQTLSRRPDLSVFELFLTCSPPILESFLLQAPTSTILALYHTSSYLRQFIRTYPTSWKYLSFRLQQPQQNTASTGESSGAEVRQSSNYALDQLLIYIVNPFSTCLTSLELDNTAVSGQILTQTVLHLRRDTLTHLSVRGCKNVSLKYHINPWLTLYALTHHLADLDVQAPKELQHLALKSLYVYRCRHHRRRPYLPQSLLRKDSDSEPTHELVNICHKLGIWTDTAWCTTPGARCDRRKGYVSQRVPPDPREVWVVYDRLWRSKNWLGPAEGSRSVAASDARARKRKRDGRSWEYGEDAANGEALGTREQGKALPAHLRQSHRQFVDNVMCDNCSTVILERCEQCSVRMHCSGCRKTLCASCAYDRPYLRNKNASDAAKNSIWWAPGCAVSPCSMQDDDLGSVVPGMNLPATNNNAVNLPNLKLKWCCTEPSFSGGGGITFFGGSHPDNEQIKAAPLPRHEGWEDLEFDKDMEMEVEAQLQRASGSAKASEKSNSPSNAPGLARRFASIDEMFYTCPVLHGYSSQAPRNLCDECYAMETWKVSCKSCSLVICLKHDVREKMRVRICGYRDLAVEKMDFRDRQKSKSKAFGGQGNKRITTFEPSYAAIVAAITSEPQTPVRQHHGLSSLATSGSVSSAITPSSTRTIQTLISIDSAPVRSGSSRSNSTGPPSRASSPCPSDDTLSTASEDNILSRGSRQPPKAPPPDWRGCQGFLCPPNRPLGDNRRRCLAVTKQCSQCKVHVCDTCLVNIGPPCPCRGCRIIAITASGMGLVQESRFFCPNCRYDRMMTGECKRRMPVDHLEERKKRADGKARARKPLAARATHMHPGQNFNRTNFSNINDEAMEQVGEFMKLVDVDDRDGVVTSRISTQEPGTSGGILAPQEENEDDIQELTDMGVMACDLVRKIQRLRGQMPPGSAARSALPDLRIDRDEAETACTEGHTDVPTVAGMD